MSKEELNKMRTAISKICDISNAMYYSAYPLDREDMKDALLKDFAEAFNDIREIVAPFNVNDRTISELLDIYTEYEKEKNDLQNKMDSITARVNGLLKYKGNEE